MHWFPGANAINPELPTEKQVNDLVVPVDKENVSLGKILYKLNPKIFNSLNVCKIAELFPF